MRRSVALVSMSRMGGGEGLGGSGVGGVGTATGAHMRSMRRRGALQGERRRLGSATLDGGLGMGGARGRLRPLSAEMSLIRTRPWKEWARARGTSAMSKGTSAMSKGTSAIRDAKSRNSLSLYNLCTKYISS